MSTLQQVQQQNNQLTQQNNQLTQRVNELTRFLEDANRKIQIKENVIKSSEANNFQYFHTYGVLSICHYCF